LLPARVLQGLRMKELGERIRRKVLHQTFCRGCEGRSAASTNNLNSRLLHRWLDLAEGRLDWSGEGPNWSGRSQFGWPGNLPIDMRDTGTQTWFLVMLPSSSMWPGTEVAAAGRAGGGRIQWCRRRGLDRVSRRRVTHPQAPPLHPVHRPFPTSCTPSLHSDGLARPRDRSRRREHGAGDVVGGADLVGRSQRRQMQ
jgi:hypothetical protein